MRTAMLIFGVFLITSCQEQTDNTLTTATAPELNVQAELDAINKLRDEFQLAINEGRRSDLGKYVDEDMEGVSPGGPEWLEYKRQREQPSGMFSYDSIVMTPRQTLVLNDSMAYDYGTSKVYYVNNEGTPIVLEDTFIVILKKDKEDGRWKLYREVASAIVVE